MALWRKEASTDGAGAEASRAAGGFGTWSSRVGTLSDICLLTAAGATSWKDERGQDGGRRAEAFSHNQHPSQDGVTTPT